jgi:hypothetical protein
LLDEHSRVFSFVVFSTVVEWCLAHTPLSVLSTSSRLATILAMVPPSVWKAVPLTLLSTILGIVVVPYCIFQVDDFFQRIADRKRARAHL